ncbi:TetR/AcrR family transcriptional regulator [Mesorhizobium sp. AaZ16]|uniref:TetR/AcrR family transcriptional regulator n=1 Tax=Mesorhizobium sp. AaZ16 TaxID=3402289 RepID=UPI00374EAE53
METTEDDVSKKPSLRSRQRVSREASILKAARAAFAKKDYHSTRIEDIAEAAEVAPATVYNYFQDKGGILLALFLREVEERHEQRHEAIKDLKGHPVDAVRKLMEQFYLYPKDHLWRNRNLWREVYAASFNTKRSALSDIVERHDGYIGSDIIHLLKDKLLPNLDVDEGFSAEDLGETILAIGNFHWNRYVMGVVDFDKAKSETVRQVIAVVERFTKSPKANLRPGGSTREPHPQV